MRRLRSLTACLLLAIWLPATLHCDMEAAGMEGIFGCHDHDDSGSPHCPDDPCHTIEGLSYQLEFGITKAPQPVVVVLDAAFDAADLVVVTIVQPREVTEECQAPPELARTWQFVVRAASLPGAPSLAS